MIIVFVALILIEVAVGLNLLRMSRRPEESKSKLFAFLGVGVLATTAFPVIAIVQLAAL